MSIIRTLLLVLLSVRGCGCCAIAVAQLPANDANKYQLVIVGSPTAPPATWFDDVPELAKLKAGTAFTVLKPKASAEAKDGLFEARYKSILGSQFPIIAFLRPDGGVIYFADRHTLPARESLYGEIKEANTLAKQAAKPADKPLVELPEWVQEQDWAIENEDCVDGSCDVPFDKPPTSKPLFPRLRRNPLDGQDGAVLPLITGWFSDSINSGIFLVFSVVCLMVIVLFSVLIFGAMIVVVRWVVK